jgi:hypothetical protein
VQFDIASRAPIRPLFLFGDGSPDLDRRAQLPYLLFEPGSVAH